MPAAAATEPRQVPLSVYTIPLPPAPHCYMLQGLSPTNLPCSQLYWPPGSRYSGGSGPYKLAPPGRPHCIGHRLVPVEQL